MHEKTGKITLIMFLSLPANMQEEVVPRQHELMHQQQPISHIHLLLDGSVELTALTAIPKEQRLDMDTLKAAVCSRQSTTLPESPPLWGAKSLDVVLLPSAGSQAGVVEPTVLLIYISWAVPSVMQLIPLFVHQCSCCRQNAN